MAILKSATLRWTKLKDPVPNYEEDGNEYSVDIMLSEEHEAALLAAGISEMYIKTDKKTGEKFWKYVRPEFYRSGDRAPRVPVIDAEGSTWDYSVLMGNGTVCDVSFSSFELAARKKLPKRNKPMINKIMIKELVEFKNNDDEFTFVEGGTKIKEEWSEDE